MKIVKTKLDSTGLYNLFDMKCIEISNTTIFDIFIKKDKDYVIIIEAGTKITQVLYDKLNKQEALYIDKRDVTKQVLSPKTLKYHIKFNQDNVEKRLNILYDVNTQIFEKYLNNKDNKIDIKDMELLINSVIYLINYDNDFVKNTMPYFTNKYNLAKHSLHVSFYAVKLGHLLNYSDNQLALLGLSALLHDIGYKKIDQSILNKEDKHTDDDTKQIFNHCRYSVEIAKQNGINDTNILDALMHHHERYDGSGYPHGLRQKDMSDFASILSICDVFDALTNHRPHRQEHSSFEALKLMLQDSVMLNQFNQKYLHLALKSLQ